MAIIKEIKGNIFNANTQVIVNTVNCVGVMGKGIAFEFKHRYPDMFLDYVEKCKKKEVKIGFPYLWTKSTPWILNFPTKYNWKFPSKLPYIEKGLKTFSEKYIDWGIKSIAFPKLGSTSGKLAWQDVKKVMYLYLEPLELDIEIYSFDENVGDELFEQLKNKIENLTPEKLALNLEINQALASKISRDIMLNKYRSMYQISEAEGIGEKTIEKLYSFAIKNTINEKQLKL